VKFQAGEDVIVNFGDIDHPGEVIEHRGGYVMVRIIADPAADYGSITDRLDPEPTLCVRETRVRHAEKNPKTHAS
jgi:hypothetical protein